MIQEIEKEKRIDEGMTIEELAIMVNNGFTNMQSQINDLRVDMTNRFEQVDKRFAGVDAHFDSLEKRFDNLEKRFDHLENQFDIFEQNTNKHFDLLDKNIVSQFEFKSLSLRVDKVEHGAR